MAYKYFSNRYFATAQDWHDGVRQLLLDAGWVQHDQVAATYTIMKSDGHAADGRFIYMKILMTGPQMWALTNWNAVAHTYIGGAPVVGYYAVCVGGSYASWFYADLDGFVGWITNAGALVAGTAQGCIRPVTEDLASWYTTTTALCTTGTNVVVSVTDTSKFVVNARYIIVDASAGKRCPVLCTAIGSGNITVNAIANGDHASGSYIGTLAYPWTVMNGNGPFAMQQGAPTLVAATITITSPVDLSTMGGTPGPYGGLYWLAQTNIMLGVDVSARRILPVIMIEGDYAYKAGFVHGIAPIFKITNAVWANSTLGASFNAAAPVTIVTGDVETFGTQLSGTSTGSNSATTLNDTTRAWATDIYAGKVVVLIAGPEGGQVSKIISNTATQLVVTGFFTVPTTNTYVIVDSAYRCLPGGNITNGSGCIHLFPEGV